MAFLADGFTAAVRRDTEVPVTPDDPPEQGTLSIGYDRPMHETERFNLAEWLLDRNVREGRGDRPALRYEDLVYSYAELLDLENRCGNALRELGTGTENRVLIVLPDCPEFAAAWFATLKIGAVFAMANTIHPAEDYAYYLDYTRAPVAVVHASVLGRFEEVLAGRPYLRSLLVVREERM